MTLPRAVAVVLAGHVAFEVECIDRMYCNVYVPQLQWELGTIGYLRDRLGCTVNSTAPLAPITEAFSAARSCSAGRDLAIFLISRRWPRVNFGGRPPLYLGYSELNPSVLKLRITSRPRSSLVKATFAIAGTAMPWADNNTVCARRQVTTDLAHDPHQAPSLVIVNLTHPQAFGHRPSLRGQHARGSARRQADRAT